MRRMKSLYHQLDNGLTVIILQKKELKNAVVNVFVASGSASEDKSCTGLAHFLEHMMFEGSRLYPNFDKSLQQLLGENNAFTGQDYTNYYETIPSPYIPEVLKIELDRLEFLDLKKKNINLQQRIIVEEFKETSINPPMSDCWHHILKMCYSKSYSWPVIGKKIADIQNYSPSDIRSFYQSNYCPSHTTITVVSDRTPQTVFAWIKNEFESWKSVSNAPSIPEEKKKYGTQKTLRRKNISNTHFFISFHIADFGERDYFMADIISDALTSGSSSILYQDLIVDKKLCTDINSYTSDNIKNNLLTIEGHLAENTSIDEVLTAIQHPISNLISKKLLKYKLETLKNKALTYWHSQLYSPTELAYYTSLFYQAGIECPLDYINDLLSNISSSEIQNTVLNYLRWESANILVYEKG